MIKRLVVAVVLATFAASAAPVLADSQGQCGKGKIWDADQQKCIKKPSGGSGSGAEIR